MVTYKGWIPTSAGMIPFHTLGKHKHKQRFNVENRSNDDRRYFISYQKRWLSDGVLLEFVPSLWLREKILNLFGLEGLFWYVCVGEFDRGTYGSEIKSTWVHGSLFMFRCVTWEKVIKRINSDQSKLTKLREDDLNGWNGFSETLRSLKVFLKEGIESGEGSEWVDYKFDRDGELVIHKEAEVDEKIIKQLFCFVKDFAHTHQHHYSDSDTVTSIFRVDDDCIGKKRREINWRQKTLKCLYRYSHIHEYTDNLGFLHSSLGMLSYAETFRILSNRKLKSQNYFDHFEHDQVRKSIDARRGFLELQRETINRRNDNLRTGIIGLFGLVLSYTGLLRLAESPIIRNSDIDKSIINISQYLLKNPLPICAGIIVASYVFYRVDRENIMNIFISMYKIIGVLRKENSVFVSILLITIMCVFFYIFY
ncbi:MAG: hypothetical protein H7833_18525 [Magnetococcus sp. DMHC-1]